MKGVTYFSELSIVIIILKSDNSDTSSEVRNYSCLLIFIVFAKLSSSWLYIFSLNFFTSANFQLSLIEMKINSGNWTITKSGQFDA